MGQDFGGIMTRSDLHDNSKAEVLEVGNDPKPIIDGLIESVKKQQINQAKLRGKPWPKGVSGNPKGRPRGARNKFTQAVLGAFNTKPMKPGIFLDPNYPHIERAEFYIQRGRKFHLNKKEVMPGVAAIRPERLDRRQKWGYECVHQGRQCIFTTDGSLIVILANSFPNRLHYKKHTLFFKKDK
jgi:hypothetical protein